MIAVDLLKDFDFNAFLVLVIPGAIFSLFRSFAIRGRFPSIAKDDFAAFLFASTIYDFFLASSQPNLSLPVLAWRSAWSFWFWLLILVVVPTIAGLATGLFEASDVVGRVIRRVGVKLPSPTPTAWETLFKELSAGSVLLITLVDGTTINGRWTAADVASSASTDPDKMDLFLAEIGTLDGRGRYLPKSPPRGIYISTSQIQTIEVIFAILGV